ncbi:MAG: hypothetical protein V1921_04270 [Candidatus Altiarchaeota archaeon]
MSEKSEIPLFEELGGEIIRDPDYRPGISLKDTLKILIAFLDEMIILGVIAYLLYRRFG